MRLPSKSRVRANGERPVGMLSKGRKGPMTGAESRALYAPTPWPFGVPKPEGWKIEAWAESDVRKLVEGGEWSGRRTIDPRKKCGTCFVVPSSSTGACFC